MQFATEEARAAVLMARAAVLRGEIAKMEAENAVRASNGQHLLYGEEQFQTVIDRSGCTHNDVVTLMIHGSMA